MIICSIATNNHLPRAMIMAKSVKKHMPWTKVVLCLVEREIHESIKNCSSFDTVILAKDLGFDNFDNYIFKYTIQAAAFSLKGKLLAHALERYRDEDKFVYLDSDVQLFSPFDELQTILETHSIVLTPHVLKVIEKDPQPITNENEHLSIKWRELGHLRKGLFNAGFVAIKRTEESEHFLRWWIYRLERFCYCKIKEGINYDQKWLDLVPLLFNAHILKHPGYNMAFWNLSERQVYSKNYEEFTVNGQPLIFFHFSGIDWGDWLDGFIDRCYPNPKDAYFIHFIKNEYAEELRRLGNHDFKKIPWSYGTYFSGEEIGDKFRKNYRKNQQFFNKKYDNAFAQSNEQFIYKREKSK